MRASVAQGIEHRSPKAGVVRSNRIGGTSKCAGQRACFLWSAFVFPCVDLEPCASFVQSATVGRLFSPFTHPSQYGNRPVGFAKKVEAARSKCILDRRGNTKARFPSPHRCKRNTRRSRGSISAAARSIGSSSSATLAERESTAHVFPHHLGQTISMQPKATMRKSSRLSMSLGLYPFEVSVFYASFIQYFAQNSSSVFETQAPHGIYASLR